MSSRKKRMKGSLEVPKKKTNPIDPACATPSRDLQNQRKAFTLEEEERGRGG